MRIYKGGENWNKLDAMIKERGLLTASKACFLLGIDINGRSLAAVRQAALELGHGAIDCQAILPDLRKRKNYALKLEIKNKLGDTRGRPKYLLVEKDYYYSIMDRLKA